MVQLSYIVTGTGRSGTVGLAATLSSVGIPCSHERFFNGNSLEEALRLMKVNGGENSLCSQHCGLPGQTDKVVAESSYMAAPYLDAPCLADVTVIHAVRNPWKVILSFLNNIQFFRGQPEHEHEQFIYSVLPQLHEIGNPVDRAVYYYIHWNSMIETLGRKRCAERHHGPFAICQGIIESLTRKRQRSRYIFHRIEDGPASLLQKLGLSKDLIGRSQLKKDVNAFAKWPSDLRPHTLIRRIRVEHLNASKYASELWGLANRYGYGAPFPEEMPTEPVSDEAAAGEGYEVRFAQVPYLLEEGYHGYNLVRWRTSCYALSQGEDIKLEVATENRLKELMDRGMMFVARGLADLKARLDEASGERVKVHGEGLPIS